MAVFVLASCGRQEFINGFPVPPEPDPILNNATIAGIDTNHNGVRDDIEREIAKIAISYNDYNSYMEIQKTNELLLMKNADTVSIKNRMLHNTCNFSKSDVPPEITELTLNTEYRKFFFLENMKHIGGLMTPELSPCPGVNNDL